MPRKRMLWPGFFDSEQLALLELEAVYTFAGYWCFADDKGRHLDDADQLWLSVWPRRRNEVSSADVARHLTDLTDNGQLCRYVVGGGRFIHAIAWLEHQKINHPTPSKLPPCPEHEASDWTTWWKNTDTATERWRRNEKAAQRAKTTQVVPTGVPQLADQLATPSQSSSVQISSVHTARGSGSRSGSLKNQYVRQSQRRTS